MDLLRVFLYLFNALYNFVLENPLPLLKRSTFFMGQLRLHQGLLGALALQRLLIIQSIEGGLTGTGAGQHQSLVVGRSLVPGYIEVVCLS